MVQSETGVGDLILSSIIPYEKPGGLHHETVRLDRELGRASHFAVCPPGDGAEYLRSQGVHTFSELHERPSRSLSSVLRAGFGAAQVGSLRRVLMENDVDVARVFGLQNVDCLIAARSAGTRVVMNISSDYVSGTSLSAAVRLVEPLVAGFMATGADLGNSVRQSCRRKPVAVYSPLVHLERRGRRELSPARGVKVIGTVSKFTHQKDLPLFVEVCEKVRRSQPVGAVVVGGFDQPAAVQSTAEQAIQAGWKVRLTHDLRAEPIVDGDLVFTGRVSDVSRELSRMDVFLLSSRYEGLPGALLEAALHGVPAVAPAIGSIPSTLADWPGGLVCDRDVEALAKGVLVQLGLKEVPPFPSIDCMSAAEALLSLQLTC